MGRPPRTWSASLAGVVVAFDAMDEPEVRSLVNGWYARARREDDHVTSFVFLWFCFNAWLACESEEDTDRAMIDWLTDRKAGTSRLQAAYNRPGDLRPLSAPCGRLLTRVPSLAMDIGPERCESNRRKTSSASLTASTRFGAISSTAASALGIRAMKRWSEHVLVSWNSG